MGHTTFRDECRWFREAHANSIDVRLADDVVVKVASMAGLALLKIVAWSDRRFERDPQDLELIMGHYLDAGNQDRVYSDQGDSFDLLNEDFDYDNARARILGRDLGRLLTNETRLMMERILSEETDGAVTGALAMAMVKDSANCHSDSDVASTMLAALRQGVLEIDAT